MATKLTFTLFCLTTVYLLGSFSLADDPDETVRALLGKLEKFRPTINSSLDKVVETMRKNRQAARAANLAFETGQVASLQAKIDKVGKLLGIVADLIWDRLYFATDGGKIMVHSLEIGDTKVVVQNPNKNHITGEAEGFYGITYDPKEKKMYFSSRHAIYRANLDGSELEMVLSDMKYKRISGLAFDWIGRNLYGVSWAGIVVACKERATGQMECYTVWEEPGQLEGIVVDPNNGTMYWTAPGKIMKSNMDGSEPQVFLDGILKPFGMAIVEKNLLVSTDPARDEVRVTMLDATDQSGNITLPTPTGIAFDDERGCFGTGNSIGCKKLTATSNVITIGYNASERINHLLMPGFKYPYDRDNNCDTVPACKSICLLKPNTANSSSRCLDGHK